LKIIDFGLSKILDKGTGTAKGRKIDKTKLKELGKM